MLDQYNDMNHKQWSEEQVDCIHGRGASPPTKKLCPGYETESDEQDPILELLEFSVPLHWHSYLLESHLLKTINILKDRVQK